MFLINPYRHNCEIVKNFFAKPIVLIISILFFITSIFSVAFDIITNHFYFIPITYIISAVGFLRFYIISKSKKEATSFSKPANLLLLSSIISIVINSIAFLLPFIFLFFSSDISPSENSALYISIGNLDFSFDSFTLISYLPIFLLNALSAIALLILSISIKKSSSSIYLYKKGSFFLTITSFALSLAQIYFIIFTGISIQSVTPAMYAILSISLAMFSIMYNRYISNVIGNLFIPKQKVETIEETPDSEQSASSNSTYDHFPVSHNDSNEHISERIPFEPQSAFVQNTPTPAPTNADTTFSLCSFCGTKCPSENLFCGNCGNKLTK